MDINGLNAKQLADLIRRAEARQLQLSRRLPVAAVLKKLRAAAREAGYRLVEVFPTERPVAKAPKRRVKRRGRVAAKYRNPEEPSQTWSGRGSKPRWFSDLIRRGRNVADLVVPGGAKPTPSKRKAGGTRQVVKRGS